MFQMNGTGQNTYEKKNTYKTKQTNKQTKKQNKNQQHM